MIEPPPIICLLLCLLLCTPAFSSTVAGPDAPLSEFSFVVLGDAQFDDPPAFNRIIDQVRRLNPAFVIQVGDLIEGYNSDLTVIEAEWQRFAAQIAPLGDIRYYPVPGNHDLYGSNKRPDRNLERMFEERWGPLHYSFTYKDALFIALNSDGSAGSNRIDDDQFDWLQATLRNSQATHKFVFMHRPPFLLKNSKPVHALLQEHRVVHVYYGHHHHYHFYEQDGVRYTMTNAAGDGIPNQPLIGGYDHLLLVSVRGERVNTAIIEADTIAPHDLVKREDNYDFFGLSRNLVRAEQHLKAGHHDGERNNFSADVTLRNPSARDVQVYVRCSSADHRWEFTPRQIPAQAIGARQETVLNLALSYARTRVPESTPECHFNVPLQTHLGAWIEVKRTLRLIPPDA